MADNNNGNRRNKQEMQACIDIGIEILRETDFGLNRDDFKHRYVSRMQEIYPDYGEKSKEDTVNKDIQRIKKAANELEDVDIRKPFEFPARTKEKYKTNENNETGIFLTNSIKKNVHLIYIEINGKSYKIYSSKSSSSLEDKTMKDFVQESKKDMPECELEALVHVFFIFASRMKIKAEDYLCSFCKDKMIHVLYTSAHNDCSEIVFRYRDIDENLRNIWRIMK